MPTPELLAIKDNIIENNEKRSKHIFWKVKKETFKIIKMLTSPSAYRSIL